MSRIAYCPACSNEKHGVKTRIAVPHTCERRGTTADRGEAVLEVTANYWMESALASQERIAELEKENADLRRKAELYELLEKVQHRRVTFYGNGEIHVTGTNGHHFVDDNMPAAITHIRELVKGKE